MEKKVSKIYNRAYKELEKKTADHFKAFEAKDKAMLKKVADGKVTQDFYNTWRRNQMLSGGHWEEMKKTVAAEITNASKTAAAYVNGELPKVYALNYNAFETEVTGLKGYSFELVDASTVRNLAKNNKTLLPYKYVDDKRVERWATRKVNSEVMQGIVQGESIPKIAKRLRNVTEMDKRSAVRNARTTVTSAENKGRLDSYHDAEDMGIVLKKVWVSSNEPGRTREAHMPDAFDELEVDVDDQFRNTIGYISYPGDPYADPENVYNCRCSMKTHVIGFKNEDGTIRYIKGH